VVERIDMGRYITKANCWVKILSFQPTGVIVRVFPLEQDVSTTSCSEC